ncbi:MAG TPA: hypothetical protein VJV22_02235 [Acidobacteriaceae bacterium]|nr:hypothetical protein [Acidobacteriaceae bacterium]
MVQNELQEKSTARGSCAVAVPLWRLYTLRVCYLILSAGLAVFVWPSVIHHSAAFAVSRGIQVSLIAAIGALALLGFRHPVRMIPLLLFELVWKTIYLAAFAWPLWRAHLVTPAVREDITAVLMVVILIPLIPWGAVWRQYVSGRSEPWS